MNRAYKLISGRRVRLPADAMEEMGIESQYRLWTDSDTAIIAPPTAEIKRATDCGMRRLYDNGGKNGKPKMWIVLPQSVRQTMGLHDGDHIVIWTERCNGVTVAKLRRKT